MEYGKTKKNGANSRATAINDSRNVELAESPENMVLRQYCVPTLPSTPSHPKTIIEPKSSLGKLIIRKTHQQNLHAGPATTLGLILDKYFWKRMEYSNQKRSEKQLLQMQKQIAL
uniref:Integrase_H2C2 domain-containing protein n=1 Tax=Caenorhabditis tropicalis TaxID=1561998 RepID=A0A1I7UEI5_9PELO